MPKVITQKQKKNCVTQCSAIIGNNRISRSSYAHVLLKLNMTCADLLHITGMGHGNMGFSFQNSPTDNTGSRSASATAVGSDVLEGTTHDLKLEKSNILLLGPTGSGSFTVDSLKTILKANSRRLFRENVTCSNDSSMFGRALRDL